MSDRDRRIREMQKKGYSNMEIARVLSMPEAEARQLAPDIPWTVDELIENVIGTKKSEDLKRFDEFLIGETRVVIANIKTNSYDQLVLELGIIGAKYKKSNKMTLVIPKGILITILPRLSENK